MPSRWWSEATHESSSVARRLHLSTAAGACPASQLESSRWVSEFPWIIYTRWSWSGPGDFFFLFFPSRMTLIIVEKYFHSDLCNAGLLIIASAVNCGHFYPLEPNKNLSLIWFSGWVDFYRLCLILSILIKTDGLLAKNMSIQACSARWRP